MIIYNVTISVETPIAADWLRWMHEAHVPDLMSTGLFSGAKIYRLLEQDETEHITYVAQYLMPSLAAYQRYLDEHAPDMREKGLSKFGSRFTAFRTVMEQVA